jgi:hypothetical protein
MTKQFLVLDSLQPCDVILSSSRTAKTSRVITWALNSRYSHAAFVWQGWLWIEALGDGTGLSLLQPTHFDQSRDLLELREGTMMQAFRHPRFSSMTEERRMKTLEGLERCILDLVNLEYPNIETLLQAALGKRKSLAVTRPLVRLFDLIKPKHAPGPFCSALITVIYEELGIPLFREHKPSWLTTPSDLADPTLSFLEPVSESVWTTTAADVQPFDDPGLQDVLAQLNDARLLRFSLAEAGRALAMVRSMIDRPPTKASITAEYEQLQPQLELYSQYLDQLQKQLDDVARLRTKPRAERKEVLRLLRDLHAAFNRPSVLEGQFGFRIGPEMERVNRGVKQDEFMTWWVNVLDLVQTTDRKRRAILERIDNIAEQLDR